MGARGKQFIIAKEESGVGEHWVDSGRGRVRLASQFFPFLSHYQVVYLADLFVCNRLFQIDLHP